MIYRHNLPLIWSNYHERQNIWDIPVPSMVKEMEAMREIERLARRLFDEDEDMRDAAMAVLQGALEDLPEPKDGLA